MARVYVLYNIMYFFLTCYFVFLIRIYFFDVHFLNIRFYYMLLTSGRTY